MQQGQLVGVIVANLGSATRTHNASCSRLSPKQVLEGCVLALEIAQEATSKVDELKAAMSEVAKAAGDALDSVPPLRAGTSGVSGNSGGNSVNGSGKQGVW